MKIVTILLVLFSLNTGNETFESSLSPERYCPSGDEYICVTLVGSGVVYKGKGPVIVKF